MEIEFYETSSGRSPVAEFIISQSAKMRAKITKTIELLEEEGRNLRYPISEKISGEIFQLRIQTEGEKARIMYFFVVGEKAVLTNGFIKKTQKTPPKEIEKAEKYRQEYLKRQGEKKC